MTEIIGFALLGLFAGFVSGLFGIGGAIVIVPALVYIFGFPQHRAAGTTLAMLLPPLGVFAFIPYARRGFVDVRAAILLCIGFVIGGYLGGRLAVSMSSEHLQRAFGVLLLAIAAKMLIK